MDMDVSLNFEAIKDAPVEWTLQHERSLRLRRQAVPAVATQTPSRRTRNGQPILPIAEQSSSTTHSAAELPRDVDGDDAMEASDGEPPAKRVRVLTHRRLPLPP
ncbi:hypothetical protein VaNZ11_008053 [Volvox africanus]|uniref:Uncharacterized protein n=1 Tax=Volvox africanus TaxID=51714 RepID=A0ABQ5S474_9CHLO|nr:hypothetical protein VaNZ11_008053 [Volvox africanus]